MVDGYLVDVKGRIHLEENPAREDFGSLAARSRARSTRNDKKFAKANAHSFPARPERNGRYSFFGPYLESDMLDCWLA